MPKTAGIARILVPGALGAAAGATTAPSGEAAKNALIWGAASGLGGAASNLEGRKLLKKLLERVRGLRKSAAADIASAPTIAGFTPSPSSPHGVTLPIVGRVPLEYPRGSQGPNRWYGHRGDLGRLIGEGAMSAGLAVPARLAEASMTPSTYRGAERVPKGVPLREQRSFMNPVTQQSMAPMTPTQRAEALLKRTGRGAAKTLREAGTRLMDKKSYALPNYRHVLTKLAEDVKRMERHEIRGKRGESPQGVGFRKTLAEELTRRGIDGDVVSVNDAPGHRVILHGDLSSPKAREAFEATSERVRKSPKGGFGLTSRPLRGKGTLRQRTYSPEQLDRATDLSGYTELLRSKGIEPSPGREFYPKRYGLKPPGTDHKEQKSFAGYRGWLSDRQHRQLQGEEPMYSKDVPKILDLEPGKPGFRPKWLRFGNPITEQSIAPKK